jgi:hypothetical protein
MILHGLVIADRPNEYQNGKNQTVKEQRLVILDQEPNEGPSMEQTVEYTMSAEEKEKFAGKVKGKPIKIGVTGFQVFGSKNRVLGSILKVA